MNSVFSDISNLLPENVDWVETAKLFAIFVVVSLLIGFIGRATLGKRSSLNHAVSSAMGIIFIYAVTIVVYTFNPADLARFLSPLPFVTFSGDSLTVFTFSGADFPTACSQVLSMVILAFLVNLLDSLIPKGRRILSWYLYRFLTVILSMLLHLLVSWLFSTFLPGTLVTYAPMILLGILVFMLLLGVLKVVLGLVLTAANPVIGALYTFFFANRIGKQITKAVFTTLLLCGTVLLLEHFGLTVVNIAAVTLSTYIPLVLILLLLWYLLGHVL